METGVATARPLERLLEAYTEAAEPSVFRSASSDVAPVFEGKPAAPSGAFVFSEGEDDRVLRAVSAQVEGNDRTSPNS